MGFLNSFWRQKKCRQTELTEVQITVNGTTLAVSGIDKAFVESVSALGVGEYLITFKEIAQYNLHPTYLNVSNGVGHVSAVTGQTMVVETEDLAGDPDDLDFSLGLVWLYTGFIR